MVKYFSIVLMSFVFLIGNLFADSKLPEGEKKVVSGIRQMTTVKHLEGDQYSIEFLTVCATSDDLKNLDLEWFTSSSEEYPSDEMLEKWNANENFRVLKESFIIRLGEFNAISSEKTVPPEIEPILSRLSEGLVSKARTSGGMPELKNVDTTSFSVGPLGKHPDFGKYLSKFSGKAYLSGDNTLRIKCMYISLLGDEGLPKEFFYFGQISFYYDRTFKLDKTYSFGNLPSREISIRK